MLTSPTPSFPSAIAQRRKSNNESIINKLSCHLVRNQRISRNSIPFETDINPETGNSRQKKHRVPHHARFLPEGILTF
jgi:hypothetical protein